MTYINFLKIEAVGTTGVTTLPTTGVIVITGMVVVGLVIIVPPDVGA